MDPRTILIIVALVCELGAAGIGLFVAEPNKFNLMALGFFFFFLSLLISH
jgi:hypothetical protein